jgi:hypothetical protein
MLSSTMFKEEGIGSIFNIHFIFILTYTLQYIRRIFAPKRHEVTDVAEQAQYIA